MLFRTVVVLLCLIVVLSSVSYGQSVDSATNKILNFPGKLFNRISAKTADLNEQLTKQTQKYLNRIEKQERQLQKKLSAVDSNGAKTLFAGAQQRYAGLQQRLLQDTGRRNLKPLGSYQPYTDSLHGALAFLQQNPQLLPSSANTNASPQVQAQLQKAVSRLQALQGKLQDAALIQQYMQQRNAQIQNYLSKYSQLPTGLVSSFTKYKTQAYYYAQQVKAYKDMLNDPDKMFNTALAVLNKVPAFSSFMQRNSALSGLMPGGSGATMSGMGSEQAGKGLPSRDQVLSGLQTQMGNTGPNASALAQKNTGAAAGIVSQLTSKLTGGGGADLNMPDFQPNSQKSKSFLHRLEFGVNLQTTSSSYFYPTTTDIGVSLGYKLNDNNRVGIGASYKVGWTGFFSHLQASSQGASIRSFVDIQIKKSWFASGGLEGNYQPPVYSLHLLRNLDNWQPSGLIGVSKIISMKTKVVKNTKLQFLWDFLSYYQTPAAQPFVFRVGYSF